MEKIIEGVRRFQQIDFPQQQEVFEQLAARKQRPIALFITCSDSRIQPSRITSTDPGDLFIVRNAGNLIPPFGAPAGGEIATIEYSLAVLEVRHIVICGHSQCGAMQAMLNPKSLDDLPNVRAWCQYAEATRQIVRTKYPDLAGPELYVVASEENVLVQLNNLSTHPLVAARLAASELQIYGWYYDIGSGQIRQYDQSQGVFRSLEDDALSALPMPLRSAAREIEWNATATVP